MSDYLDYGIKQPPYSLNAEQAVIGGLLIAPEKLVDVSGIIEPSDFYLSSHSEIYEAITFIADAGHVPDVITVAEVLSKRATLDSVGGIQYIVKIVKETPSAANIRSYAGAIKDSARQRKLISIGEQIIDFGYNTEMTTDEKISESQSTLLAMETHQGEEAAQVNSSIRAVINEIDYRFNNQGKPKGVLTGFKKIDEKINGIRNQNLMILAARPAMGKTTLAMNIAFNVARAGSPVLVFSAEMSRDELTERMVAAAGNLSFNKVRTGRFEDDDWNKLTAGVSLLKDQPLYIDDRGGLTIAQICSTARKQKQRNGIELILVDYLQLLSAKAQSREQEVSAISRGLKALAKELDIPIIALSQLSRRCEERKDRRPVSSDLRDSGAIEQDADIIAFLYRDEVYDSDSDRKGVAELIFTKARNFETGTVHLATRLDVCRFDDLAYEPPPQQSANRPKNRGFSYE